MRLRRLTGLERDEILNELEAVRAEIERLRAILNDEGLLLNLIEGELREVLTNSVMSAKRRSFNLPLNSTSRT